MPSIETFERNQKAVYRPLVGRDRYNEPLLGDPEEKNVRWEWGAKRLASSTNTQPVSVDATVVVNFDATLGGMMWEGSLEDYYGTGSGEEDASYQMEIVSIATDCPDLKNRFTRRILGLAFFKDQKADAAN